MNIIIDLTSIIFKSVKIINKEELQKKKRQFIMLINENILRKMIESVLLESPPTQIKKRRYKDLELIKAFKDKEKAKKQQQTSNNNVVTDNQEQQQLNVLDRIQQRHEGKNEFDQEIFDEIVNNVFCFLMKILIDKDGITEIISRSVHNKNGPNIKFICHNCYDVVGKDIHDTENIKNKILKIFEDTKHSEYSNQINDINSNLAVLFRISFILLRILRNDLTNFSKQEYNAFIEDMKNLKETKGEQGDGRVKSINKEKTFKKIIQIIKFEDEAAKIDFLKGEKEVSDNTESLSAEDYIIALSKLQKKQIQNKLLDLTKINNNIINIVNITQKK